MKIKINVPMTDFIAIKSVLPSVVISQYDTLLSAAKEFAKKTEKKGIKTEASFSVISGFQFVFEGAASDMIAALEGELKMDLKILVEGINSTIMLMNATEKAAKESWKDRQPKKQDEDEN